MKSFRYSPVSRPQDAPYASVWRRQEVTMPDEPLQIDADALRALATQVERWPDGLARRVVPVSVDLAQASRSVLAALHSLDLAIESLHHTIASESHKLAATLRRGAESASSSDHWPAS
jgi:hypothetical protein